MSADQSRSVARDCAVHVPQRVAWGDDVQASAGASSPLTLSAGGHGRRLGAELDANCGAAPVEAAVSRLHPEALPAGAACSAPRYYE